MLYFCKASCFLDIKYYFCRKNMRMRRFIAILALIHYAFSLSAQANEKAFQGKIINEEHQIYLCINFYESNIVVPSQELYGELPGYLGDEKDSRKWLITDVELKNKKTAVLTIINDYGSEDLTAMLTVNDDGTFTLKQGEGSTIKIVRNRKFTKLPKTLVFKPLSTKNQ